MRYLRLTTPLVRARDLGLQGAKSDLVLDMCLQLKADVYIFGAQGQNYADVGKFRANGVEPYFQNYHHPEYHKPLLRAVPSVMSLAVLLKLLATAWTARRLLQRQLLHPNTLIRLLALWFLSVLGLMALLAWLIPADAAPRFEATLGVVLLVPLARLLAAPLALAWNRHR